MKNQIKHTRNLFLLLKEYGARQKFFQVACLSLSVSKFLQAVSFFLPLKILILIGSDDEPEYIKYIPLQILNDHLLIVLVLMVPITYAGYIATGIFHRFMLDKDIRLWKTDRKEIRYIDEKYKTKIPKAHGHVAKAASDILLVIFSSVAILAVDWTMASVLVVVVMLLFFRFVNKVFYSEDDDRLGVFRLHRRQYIEYTTSIAFILIFFVLVAKLSWLSIGVFEALFALILSRMTVQAVQRLSIENIYLVMHMSMKSWN